MRIFCPTCEEQASVTGKRPRFVKSTSYYRTSDGKTVQRYHCHGCESSFSNATLSPCFRQKKRHKNSQVRKLLVSGVSQRRVAKLLNLSRTTVTRKFQFLSLEAECALKANNLREEKAATVEFDDLETFEHTKCKPLSVTLAVEAVTRRILGIEVSSMPARGLLVEKAKKYGPRLDERKEGRNRLFHGIRDFVKEGAVIKSDSNPHYPPDVKKHFPKSKHIQYEGLRGSLGGQGELKKAVFDPLFSLNHTCAMLRANINRLFRKTWCTTKKADQLYAHLILYAHYHNSVLLKA